MLKVHPDISYFFFSIPSIFISYSLTYELSDNKYYLISNYSVLSDIFKYFLILVHSYEVDKRENP